ncbi:LIM domain-containing protein [Scomber scombrus]|uniref:LIM domain-containing protein n=1 Tax=Scomber scombrus TaxID=13677 RepID=UPI002DD86840|nr:LIM domain-containing protein [Scomber scombrus]
MDWKSNLRRTQSLKSVPSSCDKPIWTETGLRDKKASVSQLVTSGLLETKETSLESLMKRNDERERSRVKTNLSRSRSMGSLQSSAGSIDALKSLFESKASTQNKLKSSFRAENVMSPSNAPNTLPVMNGEVEGVKSTTEEQKTYIPAHASVNDAKPDAKEENAFRKVVNQTRLERRKTIGGIDFEKIAASQADEKRRSYADSLDSSFNQTKDQLCISVKAISALYLSKVATQKPTHSISKLMAEDSLQKKDDHLPTSAKHQPGPENISGPHSQQFMQSQPSKEMLYQQRQKCELRRLLKHTHPELKMLDEVVDEELAEVLSSETGVTAAETGYEGEVLSRRLIFENSALCSKVSAYTPKLHMAQETAQRRDVSKTSAVFEVSEERPCVASVKPTVDADKTLGSSPDPDTECEEEIVRIDVQATRRIFENQSLNTSKLNPDNKFQGKVSIFGDETGAVQKRKQGFEMCDKQSPQSKTRSSDTDSTEQSHNQGLCVHVVAQSSDHGFSGWKEVSTGETLFEDELISIPDPEGFGYTIKTRAALFQNNPFISTNVDRQHSSLNTGKPQIPAVDSEAAENYLTANVKNRAHLFDSMPFDKIRHQNKDEIETMVENIKETLNSLHHVNAIHSDGSIIEVNETMIAKKAKFTLSESGPKIKYDEVAEGGAQNFILQLLPRANLKSQITYVKEDCKGNMETTAVNVPVQQHHFTTSQDTECKTANVVQLVEDILNQDNSLRKGVIIQEGVNRCAEVIVYSLYIYVDEKDVKSYCPPQGNSAEFDEPKTESRDESKPKNQGLRTGVIESTINCLNLSNQTSQDQTCSGSNRPEVTVKGNVKLFKSCIEKGDLEYLKTLQAEPTVQEQENPPIQNLAGQVTELHPEQQGDQAEESTSEWVPVDVKRLKSMFSGDDRPVQPKQSTTTTPASKAQNVPLRNKQSCTERDIGVLPHVQEKNNIKECGIQAQEKPQSSEAALQFEALDDNRVHQAELVEVIDDNEEILNLKTAIHSLQQATIEAKSFYQSSQHRQKVHVQESAKEPVASVIISDVNSVKMQRTEAELPQEKEETASNITSEHKPVNENESTCLQDINSVEIHATETCSKKGKTSTEVVQEQHFEAATMSSNSSETADQQEDEEIVFQGKLQSALDSLERSNINVTRGDFRAAMIYKTSSKERSQNVDAASFQKTTHNEICALTESKSSLNGATEPPRQSDTLNKPAASAASEKSKRPVCPKPAILPKPEHLKMKQIDSQSTSTETHHTHTIKSEMKKLLKENTTPATTFVSDQDENKPDLEGHEPTRNQLFGEALQMPQEIQDSRVQGSVITLESHNTDENIINQQKEINDTEEEKNIPVKDNMNETDESPVDFNEACKKFGGKKPLSAKNAPVKPKRVKIAKRDNKNPKHSSGDHNSKIPAHVEAEPQQTTGPSGSNPKASGQSAESKNKHERQIKQEGKVEMREKKGRTETEDECRQRLSVHMDEIMRGNITAAMDIFDNLRKKEELESILSQVEEIEEDTSEVDVRSLRKVFEDVPDWVVESNKRKPKKIQVEQKEERSPLSIDKTESKSSMAHVFGDLERASEEIMNLKEQTLARLMDIEETIKKALYSVSTLKSDSDIAGLSCLFKESLGTVQGSPSSGNISKISIGSSRKKSVTTQEALTTQGSTALPAGQGASLDIASAKQRVSPPSSPAFISIQSAARKTDRTELLPPETTTCPTCQQSPKTEEKFRTTKTLRCNSPAENDPRKGGQKQSSYSPLNPKRELSVLEVQADGKGSSISGNKTVTENFERTDNFGNRFFSSKTSTVVNTPPEIITSSTGQAVISPAQHQVTKYPEVRLPINQKP